MPNLLKSKGQQNRRSATSSFVDQGLLQISKLAEKAVKAGDKEAMLDVLKAVPNRVTVRNKGFKVSKGDPYSRRLSRHRLAPSSFETLIAVHTVNADGTVRKMIIPRTMYEKK